MTSAAQPPARGGMQSGRSLPPVPAARAVEIIAGVLTAHLGGLGDLIPRLSPEDARYYAEEIVRLLSEDAPDPNALDDDPDWLRDEEASRLHDEAPAKRLTRDRERR